MPTPRILPAYFDIRVPMSEQPAPHPAPPPRKRPFTRPTVEELGRLTEITLQLSGGGPF